MRISSVLASITIALGLVTAATASDSTAVKAQLKVDGTLAGAPIPQFNWQITGAALVGYKGKLYIREDAQGDCHYEYRQDCHPLPNGGYVCQPVPVYVCEQSYALFEMPAALRIQDKDVLFNDGSGDIKIGQVKSFLFWNWIALRDGATIQAGYDRASLLLDTSLLSHKSVAEKMAAFDALHGSGATLSLVVSFKPTTNALAKKAILAAGYQGQFAPNNNWTSSDPSTNEIGLQVAPSEGASVIANLQQNPLVTGIKPYVAAR